MAQIQGPVNGYVELTSPQLLDDKWREITFDLASSQNVLQDFVMPESGSGYVYRDAKLVGRPVHNRFLYWRTMNDIIELVEVSTEASLDDNQLRIKFLNSPIINGVNVIEFSDSIVIMLATMTSVHRLHLPHPNLDLVDDESNLKNVSILRHLTSDVLYNPANYYILGQRNAPQSQQPICATSWFDKSLLKCALSFPDSSILIVQFGHNSHQITTSDIKQTGIIGRLWSRMPNLWAQSPNDCDNAVFQSIPYHHPETNDVLLFTLCRDCRIRVFSTNTRECICNYNLISQSSFSQSFSSHANPTTELPLMRIFGSLIVVYLTEGCPEFIFLQHSYDGSQHRLVESAKMETPGTEWENLIDFSISEQKIWALATVRGTGTESLICHMNLDKIISDKPEEVGVYEAAWDFVTQPEDTDVPNGRSLVAEIFWSNHFSVATVQKALVGIAGPSVPKKTTMLELEELAFTRIVDDDQNEAWARFYNYCLQNHQVANKSLGLIVSGDETVMSVIKRSNPSFICPWIVNDEITVMGGPFRGIEYVQEVPGLKQTIESLNIISNELITYEEALSFERRLLEDPANVKTTIDEVSRSIVAAKKNQLSKVKIHSKEAIEYICNCLDLADQSRQFDELILREHSTGLQSEHTPLQSPSGVILTFELFRKIVRARMILARDLLIYINLSDSKSVPRSQDMNDLHEELYTSGGIKRLIDSLRSYAIQVWITETPIKSRPQQVNDEVINHISTHFEFFKTARDSSITKSPSTAQELIICQNPLMDFLTRGGIKFCWAKSKISQRNQAISNSFYVTETALNICKLLWPLANHICFAEYMFTQQLDDHLARYLDLTLEWLRDNQDYHFLRAANCILQNRGSQAVEILNRLWTGISFDNLLGRFIEITQDQVSGSDREITVDHHLIYKYYERLIQLFQICNNRQCLVMIINSCMSLLDENGDIEQQHRINCLRAKLFQYYLELQDFDEAYHTMVLTTDQSLRTNCLRKFIVSHCDKEQWSNLLSYPFIDIKDDFIDILNQKADSLDLSNLNAVNFYKTTYYDLLFASYVSDEEYKRAAQVMFNYSQRLAQEVPGVVSIKKQVDCLLIALNSLRCADDPDRFVEYGSSKQTETGRSSVMKRSYDCETTASHKSEMESGDPNPRGNSIIDCKGIELRYELTRARLRLLEKDQTANAIALSPLKPEEIISQMVASSMFSSAMDLAVLFKTPMDIILDGLAAKYILVMRLSTVDVAVHQDLERNLNDLFTSSYSTIDTYNYVANSTSQLVDRIWRLIDYYLNKYDGVSHQYQNPEFVGTFYGSTVLMSVVATKLLACGYDVPASLRRMYVARNPPELLRLLMKYDQLLEATELACEMIDRLLEPANSCFVFNISIVGSELPPIHLPTHLIILLISFLEEDATNTPHLKAANVLRDKLDLFRVQLKLNE